jgi:phosphohistidine phosphatase
MKTLLLLRHAKAEPPDEGMADRDRPLASRGKRDAPHVGTWLCEQELMPDAILSSDAARAKNTAELVAAACQFAGEVAFFAELYMALPETYVEVLQRHGGEADRVLVVGHNPTLDDLLFVLTGTHEGFPTAGLAVIELNVDRWEDLRLPMRHTLSHFIRGKDLDHE